MALYVLGDVLNDLERHAMRPSRLLDQHFGLGISPEDLCAPLCISGISRPSLRGNYYRPWNVATRDTGSTVSSDKDKFLVNLDVQQFAPEEINVKVVDKAIIVEGKHEEKQDEHGFISRHFVRKYTLPDDCNPDGIMSTLSSDGVLSITAPKNQAAKEKERVIQITKTGPHKVAKEPEKAKAGAENGEEHK